MDSSIFDVALMNVFDDIVKKEKTAEEQFAELKSPLNEEEKILARKLILEMSEKNLTSRVNPTY